MEQKLKIDKIRDGTVIDHIPAGKALIVLKILGISGKESNIITVAMNVKSKKFGKKDIIKIENRELTMEEVNKIALIAPSATINIIRNFNVVEKRKVKVPKTIYNLIKCPNPRCISNKENEPITPIFHLKSESPLTLICNYCGEIIPSDWIVKSLTRGL